LIYINALAIRCAMVAHGRDHAVSAQRRADRSPGDALYAKRGVRSRGLNSAKRGWNGHLVTMKVRNVEHETLARILMNEPKLWNCRRRCDRNRSGALDGARGVI
jgi:hypothetical protein